MCCALVATSTAWLSYETISAKSCDNIIVFAYLIKPLRDGLHNPIKMSGQQLQAPRIEQQSTLATGLRASGTPCLRMRELLMLPKSRDVLRRQAQAVVGDGSRRCGLRRRAVVRGRHASSAITRLSLLLHRHCADAYNQRHCWAVAGGFVALQRKPVYGAARSTWRPESETDNFEGANFFAVFFFAARLPWRLH